MSRIICVNPWDNESKHIYLPEGIVSALYAGECRWGGGEAYVLYPAAEIKNEQTELFQSMGSAKQTTVRN